MSTAKINKRILLYISYLYIIIGFLYLIYYISYTVRIIDKPEGWVLMLIKALLYLIVYSAINHSLIKKTISNKLLIIIEALLFLTVITLVFSDIKVEAFYSERYHNNITVSP